MTKETGTGATNHYINKEKFWQDFVDFRAANKDRVARGERPNIPDCIGEQILSICTRLGNKWNFSRYPYKDEMIDQAVEDCIRYIWSFDPEKSKNPFGYYTKTAWYAYIRIIQKKKKEYERFKDYQEQVVNDIFDIGGGENAAEDSAYYEMFPYDKPTKETAE